MKNSGVHSILFRNFNQDSIENFFGAMKALGYRNNNPTCSSFASSYKTLLLKNLMSAHSPGSNCEEDSGEGCLTSYKSLFSVYNDVDTLEPEHDSVVERISDGPEKISVCNSELSNDLGNLTKNYIAGYVVKKLNTIHFKDCKACLSQICSTSLTKDHDVTLARDYNPDGKYLLKYPTSTFCLLVQQTIDLISKKLPSLCHHKTLKTDLCKIIQNELNCNFINCPAHGKIFPEKFENFLIKLMVHNWCTQMNRILTGKIKLRENETDPIKLSAYCRYVTFSKKKSFK